MQSEIKVYKIKDFIRKNESGELSKDRIREIIMEIGTAACYFPDHNILIDFRNTTISWPANMVDIMKTAIEVSAFKNVLQNKIANIIPVDEERISFAEITQAAIQIKGIDYKVFTDFEDAIEWLSDSKTQDNKRSHE
jgi:hypothetical protein